MSDKLRLGKPRSCAQERGKPSPCAQGLGKIGEQAAVTLLKQSGYKILATNFRTKIGEIDIIARDRDTICFVEVKTRSSDRYGSPIESISRFKRRQILKSALFFLKQRNLLSKKIRFDVVSMQYLNSSPHINLIKSAFEPEGRYAV